MSTPLPQPVPGVLGIGSYSQASRQKKRWDALLTCEDPNERNCLRVTDRPQLVLAFEDCDQPELGYAVATKDQVEKALNFLRFHRGKSLLVHCMHGVGRSAALGLMDIADRHGPGVEDETVAALLDQRPEATPNLIAVSLADDLLGRGGALLDALLASEARNPVKQRARIARRDFAINNPQLYAKAQ